MCSVCDTERDVTSYDDDDDDATPEQIARRDAENEAAMVEWLHESDVTASLVAPAGAIRSCFTCGREFISHGPRDILCSLCRVPTPPTTATVLDALRKVFDDAITARLATARGTAEWDAAQAKVMTAFNALAARDPYITQAAHMLDTAAKNLGRDAIRAGEFAQCPACGDPSTGLCPACRESGERPARATDLEPIDAVFAPPFGLPRPAPTEDDPKGATRPSRCEGYQGNDCLNRAVITREINLSTNPESPYDAQTMRLCGLCSVAWDAWLATKPCLACGGAHHIQRCTAVHAPRASLALWGPPNPLCPKCGQAHDPIVQCPDPRAVSGYDLGLGTGGSSPVTFSKLLPVPDDPCAGVRDQLREAQEELEDQGKALRAALDQVERMEDAISRALLARNDMHPDRFVSYFDEVLTPILQGALDEEDEQNHRPDGPFASLRDMVYTECPCGCGGKEVCEEQRARVKAHDDKIPF